MSAPSLLPACLHHRSHAALVALFASLLAGGLWAGRPGPAAAQLSPERAARVDSVFADLNRTDGPGCALGVVRDGQLAYAKGYGSSNLDYKRPITPETNFYMGSVSKQFVAAAVVLAARQGHLSLGDPVRKWLPDLPDYDGRTITLRHLIHHTSGLRDYLTLADLAAWNPDSFHDTEEYLDLVYRQQGLNFDPGAKYRYSNTNYLLLAQVIEEATGSTLREFANNQMFGPLGMRDTHFHDDRTHVIRNRAVGYASADRGFEMVHLWNWEEVGSGGLYSNIEDLARWDRNFDTETVGGDRFTDQMTERGRLANGDTLDYAFGLDIGTYRGQRTVEHGGALTGFRSYYLRFPEAGRSVIVLCNLESASPGARARSVADIVLANQLTSREEERGDPEEGAPVAERSAEELKPHGGTYRSSEGEYVRFRVEGGRLVVEGRGQRFPLRAVAADRFAMAAGLDVEWAFQAEGAGPSERVVMHASSGDTTSYERVELATYTDRERTAFAGRYHSEELGVDYRIFAEGDALQLKQGDRDPKALRPGIDDEFRFGDGDGRIRFTRNGEEVTGFEVDTGRARGIRFVRRR